MVFAKKYFAKCLIFAKIFFALFCLIHFREILRNTNKNLRIFCKTFCSLQTLLSTHTRADKAVRITIVNRTLQITLTVRLIWQELR